MNVTIDVQSAMRRALRAVISSPPLISKIKKTPTSGANVTTDNQEKSVIRSNPAPKTK